MSRPWALPDPEGYMGSEEIIGPGGFVQVGLTGMRVIDLLRISEALSPLCESPIELQLGAQLVRQLAGGNVIAIPQYRWLRYRIDFALVRDGQPLMFIECDGREFHSTSEQIENDRQKDAAAKMAGIPLMRFTGSEIFNDAYACAALAIREAGR